MRRTIVAVAVILVTGCGGGLLPAAQQSPAAPPPELQTVRIGTVALNDFIQLPLALGLQLGAFSRRGITIETVAESSATKAMTDLGRGTVDVISVPYQLTIQGQINGTAAVAIALYQLRPGLVFSVGKPHFSDVRSMKDLIGRPVCVTARGTPTEDLVRWLAMREGVDPSSIPLRACGVGAATYSTLLATGEVWGALQVDPPFTKLEKEGWARSLYDTRSANGAKAVYGGSGIYPSQALIAPRQFLNSYPNTAFALVRSILEALRYIHSHSAADIARRMPAEYKEGDADLYAASLKSDLEMFSADGIMPADGPSEVLKVLQAVSPAVGDAPIELSQTFDNSFARRANSVSP